MIYEFKELKGTVFFPLNVGKPYRMLVPAFAGEAFYVVGICADSVSVNAIKANKITDGTEVIFSGGAINAVSDYSSISCDGLTTFRITKIRRMK